MVDRVARDRYAELLRHFAAGLISNRECEDRLAAIAEGSDDTAVTGIHSAIWGLYDDTRTHRMTGRYRLHRKRRREFAGCILFLQSDSEYGWSGERVLALARLAAVIAGCVGLYGIADLQWYGPGLILASAIVFAAAGFSRRRIGDDDAWPFQHRSDLDEARRHPRLLNGR